ncbi:MAG: hypothetical protein HFG61_10830 [Lachnospiraceae bacterium]|nr:hypothetical protein [Lachnospiraceae bacterium]
MTEQEKKRVEEKRNALALETVQTALNNGFSMYDIEKVAASIVCLAKFQRLEAKEADTQNLPRVWNC